MTPLEAASDSEVRDVIKGLSAFVERVIAPLEEQNAELLHDPRCTYDEHGFYVPELRDLHRFVRARSAEAGYYSLFAPAEMGGGGGNHTLLYAVWEHLFRTHGATAELPYRAIGHWSSGPGPLLMHFPDALAASAVALVEGTETLCFGLSEPEAGSDVWRMGTTARLDGDEWVINGAKIWTTNSPYADHILLFAVTDRQLRDQRSGGISCFLVRMDAPGVTVDSVVRMFGRIGGDEGVLSFENVRVPSECLVGEKDRAFAIALSGVSLGRVYNAAKAVGLARWALAKTRPYVQERKAFGGTLSDLQAVRFMLAESAMEIYATDCMSRDCVAQLDAGQDARMQVSTIKAYGAEMCERVLDRCMQMHGAMGLTNELGLVEGWHIARAMRIADGTAETLRATIAREVLKGRGI